MREYDLTAVDPSVFKVDGQQLARMSVQRFLELDPNTGDILYEVLRVTDEDCRVLGSN